MFNRISEYIGIIDNPINKTTLALQKMGLSKINIPNLGITVNNKIIELAHEFEGKGISMFYSVLDDYDIVSSSFLGDAIIFDLIDKLIDADKKLKNLVKKVDEFCAQKSKGILKFEKFGLIGKIIILCKAVFGKINPLLLTKEEQSEVETCIKEYCNSDKQIFKYSIKDNIVQALVKYISGECEVDKMHTNHRYDAHMVSDLLDESVIPDLKKLGLDELIPVLQKKLTEAYKEDVPDSKFYQGKEEDFYLHISDFYNKTENNADKIKINSKPTDKNEDFGIGED